MCRDIWKVHYIPQIEVTIDLLPKGAWGNDLSNTLSSKDWDILRNFCYKKFHNKCAICGKEDSNLNAHEVWNFDKSSRTQTLVDIIALCPQCHGVKHMRNSERIGYGENAKRHFCTINKSSAMDFANHYAEQQFRFEDLSEIFRWKVIAELNKFGGTEIKLKQRQLPFIINAYENADFRNLNSKKLFTAEKYVITKNSTNALPMVRCIEVDNYAGTITVVADKADKIDWIADKKVIRTKYNFSGKFITEFNVEDILAKNIFFVLSNKNGGLFSMPFELTT